MPPILRIQMLGRFCITYRGNSVASVNTARLQSLLAYLVLKAGAEQSREHLSFLFWPDSSESQARTNLRQLLHHLRSGLPDCDTYLAIGTHALRWRGDTDFTSDVGEFESAASPHPQETNISSGLMERLESAVKLYAGDLLPGFYDEWVQPERHRLRQLYVGLLSRLVNHFEKAGDYPAAISYCERLLSCDPLNEAQHQAMIRLHALNGDRAGALRSYHQCVAVLRRELNIEPGMATRKMHEETARLNPEPAEAKTSSFPPLSSSLPLVGRRRELSQILEFWRASSAGRALFVLVLGESGVGKTRLIQEVMNRAGEGTCAAYARCYAAEHNLAYGPVTQWLRSEPIRSGIVGIPESDLSELVRVVPELLKDRPGLSPPQPLAEGWQRRRFFEILARAILNSRQPLLLALDDLHWCDLETIEWLEFLLHFDPNAKLLVLGAARVDEVGGKHVLRPLLNRLIRDDLAGELALSPLNGEETAALARHVSRRELDTASVNSIYRDTEGNPLFVVESVLAGVAAFDKKDSGKEMGRSNLDASLPTKVRAVLASRLAQLSSPAHEVACVAATIGRTFSFELLLKASMLSENDLIPLMDELWERRIIHAVGKDLYDFSHDKLREVAYEELGPGRKGLLHRLLAETLETSSTEDSGAVSYRIAWHYERAGMPDRAIPHHVSAARSSRARYADKEAIGFFSRALDLLQSLPSTRKRDEQELEILIAMGPAVVSTQGYATDEVGRIYDRARLLCEFLNARQSYFPVLWGSWVFNVVRANFQTAQEFAARFRHLAEDCGNGTLVAGGHFIMGCTLFHVGKPAQAHEHFSEALKCYDPQRYPFLLHEYGPELGVFIRSYLAHSLWMLGHPQQSVDQMSSALTRAREIGDPFSIALALVYSAMLHQFIGDPQRSKELAEQAAVLCDEYGFRYYQAWPAIFGGWAMAESGNAAEGVALIGKGMESLRQTQSRLRRPYFLSLMARACIAAGLFDEAMKHVRDAFAAIEKTGEIWAEPEIHRMKGTLLQHQGDARGAGLSFQRAFSLARQREAASFELRAALSLSRLWTKEGKHAQAQKLLQEVRSRFAGKANAPDFRELDSLK